MASAQGFIQASAYEGYGITLVEAALAGVPIVASDVGIVGEVFVGYEHVLCAPVGDPTNLAAHIAWLIEDTQARKVLGMNARARALQHLREVQNSPEDIISDILKTLSV
jgi:glycosyltransferase involved in cell wall biosynthesis